MGPKKGAQTISVLLSVILAVVAGVMTGAPAKGDPLYGPSRLTPHAHAITAYFKLMVGGDVADVLPQVSLLLALAALFFVIAVWRLRFE